ncbi:MAG: PrsW family intramembrane metalloprotease [Actinomycetota bacterium]|nr:PrsW family intramembrane metalloprotease [Actinomycetota bacterium]
MTANTGNAPLELARTDAIRASGWGHTVRIVQPRNFTFWVMVFLFIAGIANFYADIQDAIVAYTGSLAQGTAWFAIYGAVILWIITRLDRYSNIPTNLRVLTFLFGGLVSTFAMSVHFNDALIAIIGKLAGSDVALDWGPGITAPISEEISKLMPVVLILGIAPRVVRSPLDGMILGMLGGLAFQVFEDVQYVYTGTANAFGEPSGGTQVMVLRTVLGATGHWMWSGITGAGLIWLLGRPTVTPRRALGIGLIVLAMVFHGIWDAARALMGGNDALVYPMYFVLCVVIVVTFVRVYRMAAAPEQQWTRDILGPEVAAGVLGAEEVDAIVATRRERRRFVRSKGSRAERTRAGNVLEAGLELADQLGTDGGVETPDVRHARAEVTRVRH